MPDYGYDLCFRTFEHRLIDAIIHGIIRETQIDEKDLIGSAAWDATRELLTAVHGAFLKSESSEPTAERSVSPQEASDAKMVTEKEPGQQPRQVSPPAPSTSERQQHVQGGVVNSSASFLIANVSECSALAAYREGKEPLADAMQRLVIMLVSDLFSGYKSIRVYTQHVYQLLSSLTSLTVRALHLYQECCLIRPGMRAPRACKGTDKKVP